MSCSKTISNHKNAFQQDAHRSFFTVRGGLSLTATPPKDRDPPWTGTPKQRSPLDRDPPPDRALPTETPQTETNLPPDRLPLSPWTETRLSRDPTPRADRQEVTSYRDPPDPLPVNRMTHRCKNITLPQTSFAGDN